MQKIKTVLSNLLLELVGRIFDRRRKVDQQKVSPIVINNGIIVIIESNRG